MIRIELPWPAKELSPNARVHWAKKAKHAKAARSVAFYACLREMPNDNLYLPAKPAVSLTFHPSANRRMDVDNAIARCKNYLDGIADAIKVDDSRFRLSAEIAAVKRPACVVVQIS